MITPPLAAKPLIPPKGPSGISPDPPTLDPIRAHALLCAATYLAPMRRAGPGEVVETAHEFEAYLRAEAS